MSSVILEHHLNIKVKIISGGMGAQGIYNTIGSITKDSLTNGTESSGIKVRISKSCVWGLGKDYELKFI